MELSSSVAMVSPDVFSLGSSHIQRTIPRSLSPTPSDGERSYYTSRRLLIFNYRALIAALKPLANCLCPRCLTQKNEVNEAGTTEDHDRRETLQRKDNNIVHSKIRRARKLVFGGRSLNSERVKELLDPQSLTPVRVSRICFMTRLMSDTSHDCFRARSRPYFQHMGLMSTKFLHPT